MLSPKQQGFKLISFVWLGITEQDKIGQNRKKPGGKWKKQGQTGSNRMKQEKTGQKRKKKDQTGQNWAVHD